MNGDCHTGWACVCAQFLSATGITIASVIFSLALFTFCEHPMPPWGRTGLSEGAVRDSVERRPTWVQSPVCPSSLGRPRDLICPVWVLPVCSSFERETQCCLRGSREDGARSVCENHAAQQVLGKALPPARSLHNSPQPPRGRCLLGRVARAALPHMPQLIFHTS